MRKYSLNFIRLAPYAIQLLSAAILVIAGWWCGVAFVDAAIWANMLPEGSRAISGPAAVALLVLLPWLTEGTRERATRGWLHFNHFAGRLLYGVLLVLNYTHYLLSRSLWVLVFLFVLGIVPMWTVARYSQRHKTMPLIHNLLEDTAEFINSVPLRPNVPARARALRARYAALLPLADQAYPDLKGIFAVLDTLFPEEESNPLRPQDEKAFDAAVQQAARKLERTSRHLGREDAILAQLCKARLNLHLSRHGAEPRFVFKAYETLRRLGEPVLSSAPDEAFAANPHLSELFRNTWAVVLIFCAEQYYNYELWSNGTGATPYTKSELFDKARQLYSSIVFASKVTDFSKYRAVNNLADLEFKRLIYEAREKSLHGQRQPVTASPDASRPRGPEPEESRLEELLRDLDDSLRNDPRPSTMITYAQIHYLLAHSDAFRYSNALPEGQKEALLLELQVHLDTTVRYLDMALLCGQNPERFDRDYQTLLMDKLLAPDDAIESLLAPLEEEVRVHYRAVRKVFIDTLKRRKEGSTFHDVRTSP